MAELKSDVTISLLYSIYIDSISLDDKIVEVVNLGHVCTYNISLLEGDKKWKTNIIFLVSKLLYSNTEYTQTFILVYSGYTISTLISVVVVGVGIFRIRN